MNLNDDHNIDDLTVFLLKWTVRIIFDLLVAANDLRGVCIQNAVHHLEISDQFKF